MTLREYTGLALGALAFHRLRSVLTGLGIAVGIGAVVLLTSIGEGVQQFVLSEFTQFGTTVLGVTPGTRSTFGATVGMFGTVRPLTLEDAEALLRLPEVVATQGVVQGNATVESDDRSRRTTVLGVGAHLPQILRFPVSVGEFLPEDDPIHPRPLAVLGAKLHEELFDGGTVLGRRIRVGGERYRVVGVMETKGQVLGFDLDDAVYIPCARSLELFDREGVMEIEVLYETDASVPELVAGIRRLLEARHGREDFTITTQDQMLDTLGGILDILTLAVGALGGISLFVGAVGILTITTIGVRERTGEIGLLRTLGSTRGQILGIFLSEAAVLAGLGGAAGLILGLGVGQLLRFAIPGLPIYLPWSYVVAAELLSLTIGLAAGVVPALQAAHLDPVDALRAE